MTLSESWFGAPPPLADNEQSVMQLAANRTQGKRAVGGGLHVTTQRLVFKPNLIDGRLGGKSWQCALSDIVAVGVKPSRFSLLELFSGGMRNRLRFDLQDGSCELFVVANPQQRAAELRELLQAPVARADLPAARVIE